MQYWISAGCFHLISFYLAKITAMKVVFKVMYLRDWRNNSVGKGACCLNTGAWVQIPAPTCKARHARGKTQCWGWGGAETGGSVDVAGSWSSSRFSNRPCLQRVRHRVTEQDTWSHWLPRGYMHTCRHTTHTHKFCIWEKLKYLEHINEYLLLIKYCNLHFIFKNLPIKKNNFHKYAYLTQ